MLVNLYATRFSSQLCDWPMRICCARVAIWYTSGCGENLMRIGGCHFLVGSGETQRLNYISTGSTTLEPEGDSQVDKNPFNVPILGVRYKNGLRLVYRVNPPVSPLFHSCCIWAECIFNQPPEIPECKDAHMDPDPNCPGDVDNTLVDVCPDTVLLDAK